MCISIVAIINNNSFLKPVKNKPVTDILKFYINKTFF